MTTAITTTTTTTITTTTTNNMKQYFFLAFIILNASSFGQKSLKSISLKETKRIETILSADDMLGRRAFSAGNEKLLPSLQVSLKKSDSKSGKVETAISKHFQW